MQKFSHVHLHCTCTKKSAWDPKMFGTMLIILWHGTPNFYRVVMLDVVSCKKIFYFIYGYGNGKAMIAIFSPCK